MPRSEASVSEQHLSLCALVLQSVAHQNALASVSQRLSTLGPVGETLLREHRCAECHIRKVGGDGSAIYRPQGRINTPGALRGMVEQCNLELNLALFPDEVTSISAVLNRDHYRFR